MKAKATRASASFRRVVPHAENETLIEISAEQAFANAKSTKLPENFPESDDRIDLSDIPEQDFSAPGAVRGKYREFALAAQGFVQLDPDIRPAFPDTQSVNKALRGLLRRKRQRKTP